MMPEETPKPLTDMERMEREAQLMETRRAYLEGDINAREYTATTARLKRELGLEEDS